MPNYFEVLTPIIKEMAKRDWVHWATSWKKTRDGMRYEAIFMKEAKAST